MNYFGFVCQDLPLLVVHLFYAQKDGKQQRCLFSPS